MRKEPSNNLPCLYSRGGRLMPLERTGRYRIIRGRLHGDH